MGRIVLLGVLSESGLIHFMIGTNHERYLQAFMLVFGPLQMVCVQIGIFVTTGAGRPTSGVISAIGGLCR